MSEKRWTYPEKHRWEQVPYDECPNCGKYEYTKHKIPEISIIPLFWKQSEVVWHECTNCKYSPDHPNDY